MNERKFKPEQFVRLKLTNEKVMVISYKVNTIGNVINASLHSKEYPENVMTDEILCEGVIGGKFQRKYIKEANLEAIED